MADLGTIDVSTRSFGDAFVYAPSWLVNTLPTEDKSLTGSVDDTGVPVAGCTVRLYYRISGTLARSTRTASDGTFTFAGLTAEIGAWTAVAFDPAGGTNYNALVYDKLTAI